jgi:hypothetical protein
MPVQDSSCIAQSAPTGLAALNGHRSGNRSTISIPCNLQCGNCSQLGVDLNAGSGRIVSVKTFLRANVRATTPGRLSIYRLLPTDRAMGNPPPARSTAHGEASAHCAPASPLSAFGPGREVTTNAVVRFRKAGPPQRPSGLRPMSNCRLKFPCPKRTRRFGQDKNRQNQRDFVGRRDGQ